MENGIREILGNMDRIFTILQCEVVVLCLKECNNLKQGDWWYSFFYRNYKWGNE